MSGCGASLNSVSDAAQGRLGRLAGLRGHTCATHASHPRATDLMRESAGDSPSMTTVRARFPSVDPHMKISMAASRASGQV